MDQQQLCINAATGEVSATNVSQGVPALSAILGTELSLRVTFEADNVPVALPGGTTGKFVVKALGNESSAPLLLDSAWTSSGAGAQTAYTFSMLADSVQLRAAFAGKGAVSLNAQVEWQITGEEHPRRSVPFPLVVTNSPSRSEDGAPDPALDAAWAWFKSRHVQGSNVTLTFNDVAKTMTVSAAGATAVTSVAWADVTGKPTSFPVNWGDINNKPSAFAPTAHTHAWSQITSGSPSDNAALVSFVQANAGSGQVFDFLFPLSGGDDHSYDSFDVEMKPALIFPRDAVVTHISLAFSNAVPRSEDYLWQAYIYMWLTQPNGGLGSIWSVSHWHHETFINDAARGVGIAILANASLTVPAGSALDIDLGTGGADSYSTIPTFAEIFIRVRGRYTN